MTHLSNEEIVLTYYDEPESAPLREHLRSCETCRLELARLSAVLDEVKPEEIAEPAGDYESQVWARLQWKLRAEKKRSAPWLRWLAAAAVIALAFTGGLLWNRRPAVAPVGVAGSSNQPAPQAEPQPEKILLVVVGDHFDQSERVLVELANLSAEGTIDITRERERAESLLASNRIYRRSALDSGEETVATLLDELEPVLLQIARSDDQLSESELRSIQKRVENRGLVFKLRVVRAGASSAPPPTPNHGTI